MCTFLYKSDLNETFNQSWTNIYLTNHLTDYRSNMAHQKEATNELFKESNFFLKFSMYGLYNTYIVLYILVIELVKLNN